MKLQAAQNVVDRMDMKAFRQELEDVARRLEARPAKIIFGGSFFFFSV